LLELPPPSWSEIERRIQRSAGKFNAEANVQAARLLRDLLSSRHFKSVLTPEQEIHIAPGRVVKIGLNFYLVESDRVIFQFVQPRADARLTDQVARTLMSLVHYAYAVGDFENACIEMADLSARFPGEERMPRFHSLAAGDLMTRSELNEEIDKVHGILFRLARL
jgi:hypothetical protein